jgi:hypothetical protein
MGSVFSRLATGRPAAGFFPSFLPAFLLSFLAFVFKTHRERERDREREKERESTWVFCNVKAGPAAVAGPPQQQQFPIYVRTKPIPVGWSNSQQHWFGLVAHMGKRERERERERVRERKKKERRGGIEGDEKKV